jgi:hypothetical protein
VMRRSGAGGLASDEMGEKSKQARRGMRAVPLLGSQLGATRPRKSQKPEPEANVSGAGGRARKAAGDWFGLDLSVDNVLETSFSPTLIVVNDEE